MDKDSVSKAVKSEYNSLLRQAKAFEAGKCYSSAIAAYEKAYSLIPVNPSIPKKVEKLKQKLDETLDAAESDVQMENREYVFGKFYKIGDSIYLSSHFKLKESAFNNLFSYQKEGVSFLYDLHLKNSGGVLGDDMGLGKTVMTSAFLKGLFTCKQTKHVLLVAPVSVMKHWEKSLETWCSRIRVRCFHGSSVKKRYDNLKMITTHSGICITSYGMITTQFKTITTALPVWDYIILDEGHKIKNDNTELSRSLRRIPSRHRLVLTGTLIQNNLKELWAIFDWLTSGELFGNHKEFLRDFESKIVNGRHRDASNYERRLGNETSERLSKMIEPYFLRREKGSLTENDMGKLNNQCQRLSVRKNDLVLWVYLSERQIELYRDFCNSDQVKHVLRETKASALFHLNMLKMLCDHPFLCEKSEEKEKESDNEPERELTFQDIFASGKLCFVVSLLDNLFENGHRVLFFSQYKKILKFMEIILNQRGYEYYRIDGSVPREERDSLLGKFNSTPSVFCFLLTTQVGAFGLNLTGADRVIIFEPSWNPATDNQAVDRCFRIGQKKNVVIYRLISCGTIEEKIYQKQVFKGGLMKTTLQQNKNQYRYFSKEDLHKVFTLKNPFYSEMQKEFHELHHGNRNTDDALEAHIKDLVNLGIFGVSDHDLLFSIKDRPIPEPEPSEQSEHRNHVALKEVKAVKQAQLEDVGVVDLAARHGLSQSFEQLNLNESNDSAEVRQLLLFAEKLEATNKERSLSLYLQANAMNPTQEIIDKITSLMCEL